MHYNDSHYPPLSTPASIACGSALLLVALPGLIIYGVFITIVLGRKSFERNSFFNIAGWLGVADCFTLILMIGYSAPCILTQRRLSNSKVIGGILNIGWFSGLPLLVVLAVNRYVCICKPDHFKTVFSSLRSRYYSIGCWMFGTCISIPSFFDYCPLYFETNIMSWRWGNSGGTPFLPIAEITLVVLVTSITYALNVLVFRKIHFTQKSVTTQQIQLGRRTIREQKIFIQFFITTIWLLIFDIPFITIGYLDDPSPWFGLFVSIAYTINCSINGWVYAILNKSIKREITYLIHTAFKADVWPRPRLETNYSGVSRPPSFNRDAVQKWKEDNMVAGPTVGFTKPYELSTIAKYQI